MITFLLKLSTTNNVIRCHYAVSKGMENRKRSDEAEISECSLLTFQLSTLIDDVRGGLLKCLENRSK